ncbi:unnamed protein product, partial [Chrysoparadoxa australica]
MPSQEEEVPMQVRLDRALEYMPVAQARVLLVEHEAQVLAKQTELQHMVGSRYHELIESADDIASMRECAEGVLSLLCGFQSGCRGVIKEGVRVMNLTEREGEVKVVDKPQVEEEWGEKALGMLLNAPMAIWAALDESNHLEAARLYMRCRDVMLERSSDADADVGTAATAGGLDADKLAFLGRQWSYVQQFPGRILQGAMSFLSDVTEGSSQAVGESLAAMALVVGTDGKEGAGQGLLQRLQHTLLKARGQAVLRALEGRGEPDVQTRLVAVVRLLRGTLDDIAAVFGGKAATLTDLLGESCKSEEIRREAQGITEQGLREESTRWLALLLPRVQEQAQLALRDCSASTLSSTREALWQLTRPEVPQAVDGSSAALAGPSKGAGAALIDARALWPVVVGGPGPAPYNAPRNLWQLVFSTTFARLAEGLLRVRVSSIGSRVREKLKTMLASVADAGQETALLAHEVVFAAEEVTLLVRSEVRRLQGEAKQLVQSGDVAGAAALDRSLYLQVVTLALDLSYDLRTSLEALAMASPPSAAGPEAPAPAVVDQALLIARVCWLIVAAGGGALAPLMQVPATYQQSVVGVGMDQLDAAFEIADTDGDGVMVKGEIREALTAVALGAAEERVMEDSKKYNSLTRCEFRLFATGLLADEGHQPLQVLLECLGSIAAESYSMWCRWTCTGASAELLQGLGEMMSHRNVRDDIWRRHNGVWEHKTVELEGLEEALWLPASVSPPFLRCMLRVSMELGRVLGACDAPGPTACARGLALSEVTKAIAEACAVLAAQHGGIELEKACECAHMQLIVDTLFLQAWLSTRAGTDESVTQVRASVEQLLKRVQGLVDPINLELYMPYLEAAAARTSERHSAFLSRLLGQRVNQPLQHAKSMSQRGQENVLLSGSTSASTNIMPVAEHVQRFELLPLPLNASARPTIKDAK